MATYSNQHWLLSHIRNSFISTDETGMCETVMLSDDLPKNFLKKLQTATTDNNNHNQRSAQQRSVSDTNTATATASNMQATPKNLDPPLQEVDFVCYPGLDLSDDEDIDMSTQSFDIQMYPEVGAHRFRSNTAQKLEKLDIAKRKAARIKNVNYNEEVQPPERPDLFVRKQVVAKDSQASEDSPSTEEQSYEVIKSKLSQQLANNPKQIQNKFMEYARFDGTSVSGVHTKRINVFLNMLPERERNYPLKICVLATAKIIEVIGLVCYKASIQFPDIPLKSVRHYALYMTEDNDDMEDFPPLDNREPCSKFGFSHLTLAERRPLASVTSMDYHNTLATKSMTSEEDKANLAEAAVRALQNIELNGSGSAPESGSADNSHDNLTEFESRLLNHTDMIEAPMHRTYKLTIIDKRFFKYEVTLGISGDRIEIDQHKNSKFWSHKKSNITPIDSVAFVELLDQRQLKATVRIWLKSNSSSTMSSTSCTSAPLGSSPTLTGSGTGADTGKGTGNATKDGVAAGSAHSPSSPSHYPQHSSPFAIFGGTGWPTNHVQIRFKHYDFETDIHTAEQIRNKLNCILEMRCSDIRREFLHQLDRKKEKSSKRYSVPQTDEFLKTLPQQRRPH